MMHDRVSMWAGFSGPVADPLSWQLPIAKCCTIPYAGRSLFGRAVPHIHATYSLTSNPFFYNHPTVRVIFLFHREVIQARSQSMLRNILAVILFLCMVAPCSAGWLEDTLKGAVQGVGRRAVNEATTGAYEGAKKGAKDAVNQRDPRHPLNPFSATRLPTHERLSGVMGSIPTHIFVPLTCTLLPVQFS